MKTKIVYVLTSSKEDTYLEQTLISAYSARLHNPYVDILVVTDNATANTIKGGRAEIKKYLSDIVVVDIPAEYNNMQKSRYIKTNLRKFVEGDFLYIDSDTVIAESLADIDSCDYDLGAVYDSNRPFLIGESNAMSDWYINEHADKMEWEHFVGCPNYNGGVIYAKDNKTAHDFYSKWFELWQECVKKGVNIDMISLCKANKDMGFPIKELDVTWNCQIQRDGLSFINKAKIIHCFTGGNLCNYELCEKKYLLDIKSKGYIDEPIINLIKEAKTAFIKDARIVSGDDLLFLTTQSYDLWRYSPKVFRKYDAIAGRILKLMTYLKK